MAQMRKRRPPQVRSEDVAHRQVVARVAVSASGTSLAAAPTSTGLSTYFGAVADFAEMFLQ